MVELKAIKISNSNSDQDQEQERKDQLKELWKRDEIY